MKRVLIALITLIALLAVPTPALSAPDFNVGDRVEIDALGIGRWLPGVVLQESADAYYVRTDPERPGMSYQEYTIPKTGSWVDRIRASSKPIPDELKPDKRKPTGILDCPITKGIYGRTLSPATAKRMVRCLAEYYDGDDYASRLDIKEFKIGKPRLWNPYNDIGPGTRDTQVYPIRVTAVQLWWTKESVEQRRWLRIYSCYYSTLDEWKCGLSEKIKDWPSVKRPRA